ncbi:hypothetical protein NPIL_696771 [Nephila pilipes]|uniref:Uncharacterized protein n=1 Tax=Nephila pilipes TaxID=299642 RepID=A0A8X6QUI4_NEPPI|nr:hypothetical protein NPIL_696771 [Nephila pilipes]
MEDNEEKVDRRLSRHSIVPLHPHKGFKKKFLLKEKKRSPKSKNKDANHRVVRGCYLLGSVASISPILDLQVNFSQTSYYSKIRRDVTFTLPRQYEEGQKILVEDMNN